MRFSLFFTFLAVALFCIDDSVSAQTSEIYRPKRTYDAESKDLINRLKIQLADEFENEKSKAGESMKKINQARARYIRELVDRRMFIHDSILETYVNNIVQRLVEANQLEDRPRSVLVMKTPQVNALNYGRGIFFVTLGLIARVNTEDELAFALAHELAHDELDHIRESIRNKAEKDKNKSTAESLNKILLGQSDENAVEALRKTIYETSNFSKKKELEADPCSRSHINYLA